MSIEVHVRVRPGASNSAWTTADTVLCSTTRQDHRFPFGRVYNTTATNNTIFSAVDPLIHAAFDGKNVTIMAYGQTGSGKTHSMVGSSSDSGVMRRTAEVLSNLRAAYPGSTVDASCIEIYNETVSDLLLEPKDRKPIDIRGDGVNTTYDKTLVPITSLRDFVALHANAEKYRRYGVTDLNGHSSRSHIIMTFHIRKANRAEGSVINLVDLAGSESAGKANTTGETLREGGFINKSLLALGNVVSDIVAKKSHIAFRGSNLTRLLSPCLSGDGYTFILCCINPGYENYETTVNALQFSQRAMKIKKDPTVTLTAMPPLFAFPLHKQLVLRQSRLAEMSGAAYQSGLYETYSSLQSTVLGAIFDKQNKAVADAQAEAFAIQSQLIAKDHLSSIAHLKRQREVLEGHRQRKIAALALAEETDRGARDMARRVEETRSKRHRAEEDYKALLEDSEEAKAQWRAALEEAIAADNAQSVAVLMAEEAHARLALESQRPLFLEQVGEAMMASTFDGREEVMRVLSTMSVDSVAASLPTAHHNVGGGDDDAESSVAVDEDGNRIANHSAAAASLSRTDIVAAKLDAYKAQLLQQYAELNAAAKAVRELEGDLAMDINPSLLHLSEEEALDRIHALEAEVESLQQQQQQANNNSRASTPLPTARHNVAMMASSTNSSSSSNNTAAMMATKGQKSAAAASPSSSASVNMSSRLKSAVSAIADAKSRMLAKKSTSNIGDFISSPPNDNVAAVAPRRSRITPSSTSACFGSSVSPNVRKTTTGGGSMKYTSSRFDDPTRGIGSTATAGAPASSSSASADVTGIAARRRAEGVIRGRSRV